jgi:hypothetical protein
MSASRSVVILLVAALLVVSAYSFAPRSYYDSKNPIIGRIKAEVSKIDPKFGKIPMLEGDSAFTENKEVITLCLVDPETGQYYPLNTLIYVTLHELAHVNSSSIGHGDEFKKNFADLLRRGAELGIYDPRQKIPVSYCNVKTGSH